VTPFPPLKALDGKGNMMKIEELEAIVFGLEADGGKKKKRQKSGIPDPDEE
jgi:hypothetical protein